ncbi:putative Zn-dependent protease [Haloferula luteola]|uniref:Putative Zn-dependent protease n=1 Tax=Haloferula luteola TaxID=595692 RepID=A0A840UZE4_9BACT|nr:tetratricopeptide repeat protein [Haloferula luteola]MBB5351115.1 putative Zn-dependent protease [Haloferula luteola]
MTLWVLSVALAAAHPDPSHTLAEIDAHLRAEPESTEWWVAKARVLMSVGQQDEARAVLQELCGKKPDDPDAEVAMAALEQREGRMELAEKRCRAVVAKHRHHAEAWRTLAECLERSGDGNGAREAAEKALRFSEDTRPEDFVKVASLCEEGGRFDEAVDWLEEGIHRHGCVMGLHFKASEIERQRGMPVRAVAHMDAVEARYGPTVVTCELKARIYSEAKMWLEAARMWDAALALLDALPVEERRSKLYEISRSRFVNARDDARSRLSGAEGK